MGPFDLEKKLKDNLKSNILSQEEEPKKKQEPDQVAKAIEEHFGLYKLWLIDPSGEEIGYVEVPKTIPIREGCIVRSSSKNFYKVTSPPIFDEHDSSKRGYYVIKVIAEKITPLY